MAEEPQGFIESLKAFSANSSPLDFMLVFEHWDLFLQGVVNTVALVVLSLVIGGLLSIPLAVARAQRTPIANGIIGAYVYVFRGTPLLVQTYLIYYGLGQFDFIRDSFLWPFFLKGLAMYMGAVALLAPPSWGAGSLAIFSSALARPSG